MKKQYTKWLGIGLSAALLLGMTACGSKTAESSPSLAMKGMDHAKTNMMRSDEAMAADMAGYGYTMGSAENFYEEVPMAEQSITTTNPAANSAGTSAPEVSSNRKLIRNVSMSVETLEFESFIAQLEDQVKAMGGYVENMNMQNGSRFSEYAISRHANLTVRLPKAKTDDFLNVVSQAGNVTDKSENVQDVTLEYVDMESRKKSLLTEQERLLALLEKADSLEDIITLEDRLSTIRYQVENMESQLRTYDNLVDYATVHMNISEVKELTPEPPEEEETPGQRLVNGFKDSLEDIKDTLIEFGVWFGVHTPYLILWVISVAIVLIVIRLIIRKNRKKAQTRRNSEEQKSNSEQKTEK